MKLDQTEQDASSEMHETASEDVDTTDQSENDSFEAEVSDESAGDPEPEDEEAAADDEGEDDEDEEEDEDEDEEDPEDPADALRESCTKSATCKPLLKSFDVCEERVNSKSKTEETCLEEYLSFIKCRDKCVSRDLFSKLK